MALIRNAGKIGKIDSSTNESKKGLFNTGDNFAYQYGNSPGEYFGLSYAQAIAAVTGGSVTTYSGGSDLSSTLDGYYGSTSGDVLYLPAGSYTVDSSYSANFTHTYSSSVFPSGYYAVVGEDPQTVVVSATVNTAARSDNQIVSWDDAGTLKVTIGYMTLITKSYGSINYTIPFFHGTGTTDLVYCIMKNVFINRDGNTFSMLYDNNADTGYIDLINCSIGNAGTLSANYSGSNTNKTAENCLFEPNIISGTHWGTYTDTTTNAGTVITVDGSGFGTYDTATYSTVGHLYGRSTTTFTEPA